MPRTKGEDRSRRARLQRIAGELGEVLPRLQKGTLSHLAQGWYLRTPAGRDVFLGDYEALSEHTLVKLHEKASNGNGNGNHA